MTQNLRVLQEPGDFILLAHPPRACDIPSARPSQSQSQPSEEEREDLLSKMEGIHALLEKTK